MFGKNLRKTARGVVLSVKIADRKCCILQPSGMCYIYTGRKGEASVQKWHYI